MKVDIYLRKSRADEELEKKLGQGETLARHRKALLKLAKERNYTIVNIHEELVSGEELFFRPAMLELLKDVESSLCDAVLVMDMQRLGRGDMEEQGLILKTFKKANVKIITPQKTYDLNNEFDEEYSEFEAFMSRKEYKMITRRMQGGRVRSVEEGNYIATRPPYGYDILKIDKRTRTLKPNPEQAEVVKMIFNWYVNENMGCGRIADELNRLGIKSYTGGRWERTSITNFLKNPVYIGKVVWKKKHIRKSKTPGKKKDIYTRPKEDWIVCDGKHEPIIDENLFDMAQELLKGKYHVPYQLINGVSNPLAGLVICGICGVKMIRRPYGTKEAHLICTNKCGNKSNKLIAVEKAMLDGLQKYLNNIEINLDETENIKTNATEISLLEKNINDLHNELKTLETQRLKTFDLLEQGIYDIATFTERSNLLAERINAINQSIDTCIKQLQKLKESYVDIDESIKELKHILDVYPKLDNPKDKNLLLKSVLEKIVYYKEKNWKSDNFKITLYHKTLGNIEL
jgi:DNA invertase Pin-like site-specific DNA recombinase